MTLTVGQAAAVLGISRSSAYRAARDGALPAISVRGRVLILRSPLEALLHCDLGDVRPGDGTGSDRRVDHEDTC